MRYLIRRARPLAALTACIGAAGLALGSTAAAQASTHAAPASGVAWHALHPIDGWQSAQADDSTGDPAWAVKDGVVYLAGSLERPSGDARLFAQLPPQARPWHKLWMTVYTDGDTTGTVYIYPSGKMYAYSFPDTADATGFTSLAGLSFPARSMRQHPIKLIEGWHSEQNRWNSGNPSYSVSGGVVYLSGSLATSGSDTLFAHLPKAARPRSDEYFIVYTYAGTYGELVLKKDGEAELFDGGSADYSSLAGISYPTASNGGHPLALINGWRSGETAFNTGNPAYSVRGGVVYLSGSIATSGSDGVFAVLPPGARPAHYVYIKVFTYDAHTGTVQINPDGTVSAIDPTGNYAPQLTDLAGISFPLGS